MFAIFRPWNIGKIFGIPIRVDASWILIFLLLTYQLAFIIFPIELGIRIRRGVPWELLALAVLASLLLFASVLAHEMAHALMARGRGVQVLGITLFIFGGVAQIADEPDSPQTEFLIAIVGPLISFVISIFAAGVWIWLQALSTLDVFSQTPFQFTWVYAAVIAFYLAQANLVLALFNLLPGFPLDGGRVLRAALWALFQNQRRATFWGMLSGRVLAGLLVALGVFLIVSREYGGAWLFLMAWFLWRASGEAYHALLARELLSRVRVQEIMRAPLPRISEALSLREVADAFSLWLHSPALAIDLNGSAVGLVGIAQVKQIARAKWETTRVRQAMVPLQTEMSVTLNDDALRALKILTDREMDEVAVMDDGQVLGVIGRGELARYLHAHGE